MNTVSHNRTFGKQSAPHTIIVARGDTVRHWTIRPWMLRTGVALTVLAGLACAGSTALFLTSDEIAAALRSRESQMADAYEKRIGSLRAQLDRVTSRQHLDRAAVTTQVELLLGQQEELAARYGKLEPLLDKARSSGLLPELEERPDAGKAPTGEAASRELSRRELPQDLLTPISHMIDGRLGAGEEMPEPVGALSLDGAEFSALAKDLIPTIGRSMDYVEERQRAQLEAVAENARRKATLIADLLGSTGVELPEAVDGIATGGPFVLLPDGGSFEESLDQLGETLAILDQLNSATERLPLGVPVDAVRSSAYGVRTDPFLGRKALHTGIDYAARSGTPVHATAPGKVVHAQATGSYGLMVEIDHGNGLASRYAHLSRLDVRTGEELAAGDSVGKVGSTGRSTGPHLHYEVRRDGKPVDPGRFLRAGETLRNL